MDNYSSLILILSRKKVNFDPFSYLDSILRVEKNLCNNFSVITKPNEQPVVFKAISSEFYEFFINFLSFLSYLLEIPMPWS